MLCQRGDSSDSKESKHNRAVEEGLHPPAIDQSGHLGVALEVAAPIDREDKQDSRPRPECCVQLFLIVPLYKQAP